MVGAVGAVAGAGGKPVASPGWGVVVVPVGTTIWVPAPKVGSPVAVGVAVNGVVVLGSVWAITLFEKKTSKKNRVIILKRDESIC